MRVTATWVCLKFVCFFAIDRITPLQPAGRRKPRLLCNRSSQLRRMFNSKVYIVSVSLAWFCTCSAFREVAALASLAYLHFYLANEWRLTQSVTTGHLYWSHTSWGKEGRERDDTTRGREAWTAFSSRRVTIETGQGCPVKVRINCVEYSEEVRKKGGNITERTHTVQTPPQNFTAIWL